MDPEQGTASVPVELAVELSVVELSVVERSVVEAWVDEAVEAVVPRWVLEALPTPVLLPWPVEEWLSPEELVRWLLDPLLDELAWWDDPVVRVEEPVDPPVDAVLVVSPELVGSLDVVWLEVPRPLDAAEVVCVVRSPVPDVSPELWPELDAGVQSPPFRRVVSVSLQATPPTFTAVRQPPKPGDEVPII